MCNIHHLSRSKIPLTLYNILAKAGFSDSSSSEDDSDSFMLWNKADDHDLTVNLFPTPVFKNIIAQSCFGFITHLER